MKKILIVEDDPFIRDLTTVKLGERSYETYTASNGESAFKQIKEHQPDVILLDLDLPDIKGIETLIQIKKSVGAIPCKIIIFSNNSEDDVKQKTLQNGADAFYIKAETNFDDLISCIEA